MRPAIQTLLALCLLGLAGLAGARGSDKGDHPVLERTRSERSFELEPGAATRLVVDNVFGRIRVRAHDAHRIDLRLEKTVRGRSPDLLERARREVSLAVTERPGLVDLYVDTPFRDPLTREWSGSSRGWRDSGYRVIYDFELAVPRRIELDVKTVDGGDLRVAGVGGPFEVRNVNGGIEMLEVSGPGSAETVNGPVRVTFDSNPEGDSRFVTVNGDVEIRFRPGLSADLDLRSTFGELWSEFEVRPLAGRPPVESIENGRRVIRTDAGALVRVGAGGPTHTFETLNGDVLIRLADDGAVPEDSR